MLGGFGRHNCGVAHFPWWDRKASLSQGMVQLTAVNMARVDLIYFKVTASDGHSLRNQAVNLTLEGVRCMGVISSYAAEVFQTTPPQIQVVAIESFHLVLSETDFRQTPAARH